MEDFWRKKPNCHVLSPFGCDHAKETPGYYVTQGVHYELHHSRYLQENDQCVREILHKQYWSEYQQKMQEELAQYYIEPND